MRRQHAWHVPKSTYRCDTKKTSEKERGKREKLREISVNKGRRNVTERRKIFPLSDEKITILPNRQLFMLNPLRTIGIFSLPTVILSRS